MKSWFAALVLFAFLIAICCPLHAQDRSQGTSPKQRPPTVSDPVPRSDTDEPSTPPLTPGESSSKQTEIDISPPKDDAGKHPDSDVSDVTEMHTWNPHKALKDVEVGEFYFKRRNYRAAEDRFREALTFKPGDAVATYRLAEVLDAENQYSEAVKEYQEYLKIPSSGTFNSAAKKALARLEQKNLSEKQ
jgi:tetratricopeptide (TPR) repeat protein